jgi:CubicO group peptidase (beta-lactamase class C family)
MSKMKTIDLYPFQQFINEGHSGIMVGHLNVPALDHSGTPASLSSAVTGNLLKKSMGFEGLVWTDGLAMKGAVKSGVNNCVAALKAGADVLLEPASFASDLEAVVAAVKSGALSESLIEVRCKKILAYKYALGLSTKPAPISSSKLKTELNSASADAINRRLVAASVICLKNSKSLLPIHDLNHNDIAVVNIGESKDNTFSRFCGKYAEVERYGTTGALTEMQLTALHKHDLVIAAIYSDNAAAVANLRHLEAECSDLITVFMMNPYKLAKFAPIKSQSIIVIGENTKMAQEYCAQAVFGGIRVNGSLPVKVKGVADEGACVGIMKTRLGYTAPEVVGLSPDINNKIDSLVKIGLNTGAFPGCQVLVAKDGNVVVSKSYGYTDSSKRQAVTDSTLYDLASVTKVTGTLPGLMINYDRRKLDLSAKASKYLPALKDTDKENITITDLLLHESGLPETIDIRKLMMDTATYSGRLIAYKKGGNHTTKIAKGVYANSNAQLRTDLISSSPDDTFNLAAAKGIYVGKPTIDTIMNRIYSVPVSNNKSYKYSDLNFILLKRIEEKITGQKHEAFIIDSIYAPLGAWHTSFRPLAHKEDRRVAATENDQFLRKQTVKGYVHDELAAFLGGAEGNAGLFSNAEDLAKLGQTWLNGGTYGSHKFFSPSTVKTFTTTGSKTSRRKLGFDAPDTTNLSKSPLPAQASSKAYGHLGFTGTCIWVDPEQDLVYIFLSNRINPSRDNAAFSRLNIRPAILEEVYKAIK